MQTVGDKKKPLESLRLRSDHFRERFLKSKQVPGPLHGPPIKKLPGSSFIQIFNHFAGLEGSASDGGKS